MVDSWPLMGTPYLLLSIFAVYLWVVLKAGPKFMENRKPFNLNNVTRLYNLLQIFCCAFFVLTSPQLGLKLKFVLHCLPLAKATDEISEGMLKYYHFCWYFLLLRLSEVLETIFFVLRKKQDQVTFLHIYHHIYVVAVLWCFSKYSASLNDGFIAVLNSSVHCVMYSYYFLSSFHHLKALIVKVKRFITTVQIVQLLILIAFSLRAIISCGASNLHYLQMVNVGVLVFMFIKFYFKSYLQLRTKSKTI